MSPEHRDTLIVELERNLKELEKTTQSLERLKRRIEHRIQDLKLEIKQLNDMDWGH